MKKIFFSCILLFISITVFSQVGFVDTKRLRVKDSIYFAGAWHKTWPSSAATTTASNGLTKSGNNITLGGNLISHTTINGQGIKNLLFDSIPIFRVTQYPASTINNYLSQQNSGNAFFTAKDYYQYASIFFQNNNVIAPNNFVGFGDVKSWSTGIATVLNYSKVQNVLIDSNHIHIRADSITLHSANIYVPLSVGSSTDSFVVYNSSTKKLGFKNVTGSGLSPSSGTFNFIPKWTPNGTTLGNSLIYDDGTNVGINTTTPNIGISSSFTVKGVGTNPAIITAYRATSGNGSGNGYQIALNNSSNNPVAYAYFNGAITDNTAGAEIGAMSFFTINNGTLTEKMRITGNGEVGIGTITPAAGLDLGADKDIQFSKSGTYFGGIGFAGSQNLFITNYTNGATLSSAAYSINIDLTGKVGMGTTTQAAKLDILSTTEQLRIKYNASNYVSHTVSSGGNYTIAPSGGATSITGTAAISGLLTNLGGSGQTTLVAGTKAITITGLTTNSLVYVQFVSGGGTLTNTFQYAAVCTANTLTITATSTALSTNVLDTSTLNYWVIAK